MGVWRWGYFRGPDWVRPRAPSTWITVAVTHSFQSLEFCAYLRPFPSSRSHLQRARRNPSIPSQFTLLIYTLSRLFTMAPYLFDSPNADLILRSSDGKEFRVHQFILGLASPFFRATLSSPQSKVRIRKIDMPYSSDILQPFLQYLCPRSPPKISDISTWAALYTIADKYGADVVKDLLRDMLVPRFLKKYPLRVYALASRWGFEEEARIASRRTLKTVDILTKFPQEDAGLMGATARQRLHRLHSDRREAARALINSHPRPSPSHSSCNCPSPAYANLRPALCQSLASRPWLTLEDVYRVDAKFPNPKTCNARSGCRHSAKNIHAYFCSLVRKISELPQTV